MKNIGLEPMTQTEVSPSITTVLKYYPLLANRQRVIRYYLFLILSSEINHWNIIFRLLITFFILISIQLPRNLSSHDRLKLRESGLTDLFISLSSLIQIGVSDRSSSTLLKKSFNLCLLYTSVSRTSV